MMFPVGDGSEPRVGGAGDVEVLADENLYQFMRHGHMLSSVLRELLEEHFLSGVAMPQLNRAQFCALKIIALNADLRVGELARCIGVSAAACSKNIDKLERLGLVIRKGADDDRRAILLRASAEGMRLVRDYEQFKLTHMAPVIDELGPDQSRQLCELLEKVCVGLTEIGEHHSGPCLRCAGYYQADCSLARRQGECALRVTGGGRFGIRRRMPSGPYARERGKQQ